MNRPIPKTQWNDYLGDAAVDSAPQKQPIESLFTLDNVVIGLEGSSNPRGPELALFRGSPR